MVTTGVGGRGNPFPGVETLTISTQVLGENIEQGEADESGDFPGIRGRRKRIITSTHISPSLLFKITHQANIMCLIGS